MPKQESPILEYEVPAEQPRRSKLTILSLWSPVLGVAAGIRIIVYGLHGSRSGRGERVGPEVAVAACAIGLLGGIIAVRRIRRAGGRLLGRPIAIVAVVVNAVVMIWSAAFLFL